MLQNVTTGNLEIQKNQ